MKKEVDGGLSRKNEGEIWYGASSWYLKVDCFIVCNPPPPPPPPPPPSPPYLQKGWEFWKIIEGGPGDFLVKLGGGGGGSPYTGVVYRGG